MIIIDKPIELMKDIEAMQKGILTVEEYAILDIVKDRIKAHMKTFTYVELER